MVGAQLLRRASTAVRLAGLGLGLLLALGLGPGRSEARGLGVFLTGYESDCSAAFFYVADSNSASSDATGRVWFSAHEPGMALSEIGPLHCDPADGDQERNLCDGTGATWRVPVTGAVAGASVTINLETVAGSGPLWEVAGACGEAGPYPATCAGYDVFLWNCQEQQVGPYVMTVPMLDSPFVVGVFAFVGGLLAFKVGAYLWQLLPIT